jgi:PTH1 family peptidyl-tRNA hydrolase
VGLGNPGPAYAAHRHNVGFMAVRAFAQRFDAPAPVPRFEGLYGEVAVGAERVGLLAPATYMNGSGESVADAHAAFDVLTPARTLVVHDDLDLPLGRLRLRGSGGAGGQHGLADVIERLGTRDVPRLRIGVGRPPEGVPARDWVLGAFAPAELEPLREALDRAVEAMQSWLDVGLERTMDVVNRAATTPEAG